jgi:hypothetical protein
MKPGVKAREARHLLIDVQRVQDASLLESRLCCLYRCAAGVSSDIRDLKGK